MPKSFLSQITVISGGQTGADQGGLFAAKKAGIVTTGYAPKGWMTEDGPALWLSEYGLQEHSGGYRARTLANVQRVIDQGRSRGLDAPFGAVLWFGKPDTSGGKLTLSAAYRGGLPTNQVDFEKPSPRVVAEWLLYEVTCGAVNPLLLLVAGNRESKCLGISAYTSHFLTDVFGIMAREWV